MTIREIKDQLPSVMVELPTGIYKFRTCGRLNEFATLRHGDLSFQLSWEAIQRAVNGEAPLKI